MNPTTEIRIPVRITFGGAMDAVSNDAEICREGNEETLLDHEDCVGWWSPGRPILFGEKYHWSGSGTIFPCRLVPFLEGESWLMVEEVA